MSWWRPGVRTADSERAAEAAQQRAGAALVRLDDLVEQWEGELAISGALSDDTAPVLLRRARLRAQHARDDMFTRYRHLADEPSTVKRRDDADRLATDATFEERDLRQARAAHDAWVADAVRASDRVAAAERRLRELRDRLGSPERLLETIAERYDRAEWQELDVAARAAVAAIADADHALGAALERTRAGGSPAAALTMAETQLRLGADAARRFEEEHRLLRDAATAVGEELHAAREVARAAEQRTAGTALATVRQLVVELDALAGTAVRQPRRTVAELTRLRDRLDEALGDALTTQQRLRGARSALPGSLATARDALTRAEPARRSGADARVMWEAAAGELAAARGMTDPGDALSAARRALAKADAAAALASGVGDQRS